MAQASEASRRVHVTSRHVTSSGLPVSSEEKYCPDLVLLGKGLLCSTFLLGI